MSNIELLADDGLTFNSDFNSYNNWQKKKIVAAKDHQDQIYCYLNNQNFIKRDNKKITLEDGRIYTEFISCSYLGLDQDKRLLDSVTRDIYDVGLVFSSARTRMKYWRLDELENMLNSIFGGYSVIFSSTHLTHLGLIPLIASGEMPTVNLDINGASFILDSSVHASIQINRGLMQQFGRVTMLDFNDLNQLETKLRMIRNDAQTPILFCDSVGSMGGMVPLDKMFELVNRYQAYLYLDDAHGMSIYGKNGAGYVIDYFKGLPDRVILVTSLAKGFGASGGVLVSSEANLIKFIKKYCSTYMFSGSLINPLINASIESAKIHLSPEINILQKQLVARIELFDSNILKKEKVINYGYNSPIRGLLIGNEFEAINLGIKLKNLAHLVSVVTYPIKKQGKAILRLTISSNHTEQEVQQVCKIINSII